MDYQALAEVATQLIKEFGKPYVLTQNGSISTGWLVQTQAKTSDQGTNTNKREVEFLIEPTIPTAPKVGGILQCGGPKYRINAVENINPGATLLIYKVIAE